MHYTYILVSKDGNGHYYVGSTEDLVARFADHNAGRSAHTAKYRPWKLAWYCAFTTASRAKIFEQYLKTASGRAFQKKHL